VKAEFLNVIMFDLDHFKSINDTYGHSAGDSVLRATGDLARKVVGNKGVVCRYGGEEFAILLNNMSFIEAIEVANALQSAFAQGLNVGFDVTASLGISNGGFGAMDQQHLMDQADQCLYVAKRSGRKSNCAY
jgi:diguanylate cyclase (GGDEF)-like protein